MRLKTATKRFMNCLFKFLIGDIDSVGFLPWFHHHAKMKIWGAFNDYYEEGRMRRRGGGEGRRGGEEEKKERKKEREERRSRPVKQVS